MKADQFKKIIEFLASDEFKKILENLVISMEIAKPLIDKVKERFDYFRRDREEKMDDGMNRNQYFKSQMKEYAEVFEEEEQSGSINFNIGEIIFEQIKKAFTYIEETLNLSDNSIVKNIQEYKKYLEEELSQEEETLLINKLYAVIEEVMGDERLKNMIGEDYYKELVTIIIVHSMKVSRVLYNYGMNKINEFELKEKIETLYEDYVLSVVNFVKNNRLVREHAFDIINFAFGNKAHAILSVVNNLAVNMFDEEKREEVAHSFSKAISKVKSWYGNVKSKFKQKGFEKQYETPES